ncbi:uncharacterized protein LOC116289374 [Actinia tenebrosa]|uniref:Uncharacterized protein LOC116289374 n=1 Tax=Actinia tenebrosa TaxID=6105 RepID=A0A6P8H9B9_ACTTE|nr:uncharacterized protein LOC116289374 [Actinia tenebrosa]
MQIRLEAFNMAFSSNFHTDTAIPENTTTIEEQSDNPEKNALAVDLVSIGSKMLNFSNKNQTVDNFEIKWPMYHELLTQFALDWGFFVDVDHLDENATLKIGIFVPSEVPYRACNIVWDHEVDPSILRGTIWYWNLINVRKRDICMMSSPTTVRQNYGNRSEVHIGSSVGVYKDSNGSLHFVVDNKDLGVAVEKISRRFFYGWIRIGNHGIVRITHRIDLSFGNYSRHVLSKGLNPRKEIQSQNPPKTSKQKESSTEAKKGKKKVKEKKGKEKVGGHQSSQNDQQARVEAVTHTEERAGQSKPLYVYRMTKKPRGHCLIISNSKFYDNSRNREGADADEKALKSLFQELHFTVTIKKNLTAEEMGRQLYDFSRKDHEEFDAFVCVIMTHGTDNNILLGVDDRKTNLEDLMTAVKPTNCRSLQGKPKFFIVQACRGDSREEVAGSYCPRTSFATKSSSYRSHCDTDDIDIDGLASLTTDSTLPRSMCPIEGDFLLAFATTPGYVALRDPKTGSIFVQVLVDVFRKNHNHYHVLDLLVEVNRQVAVQVETLSNGMYWQIPAPSFTLRGVFYLRENEQFPAY